MNPREIIDAINKALDENDADREAHLADATISALVAAKKLPAEALTWKKSE